jgi:hypothetical protein
LEDKFIVAYFFNVARVDAKFFAVVRLGGEAIANSSFTKNLLHRLSVVIQIMKLLKIFLHDHDLSMNRGISH